MVSLSAVMAATSALANDLVALISVASSFLARPGPRIRMDEEPVASVAR
jgi:hypothetical protein